MVQMYRVAGNDDVARRSAYVINTTMFRDLQADNAIDFADFTDSGSVQELFVCKFN